MNDALTLCRAVLASEPAWLVGGAVRDLALGRAHDDVDLVVAGDPRAVARAIGRATGAAVFELSEDFGAWRVAERGGAWRIDVNPLRGGTLLQDLRARDFTVNAIAQPLQGGELLDPLGGLRDLDRRTLRAASAHAFSDDPLRVLRLVRLSIALDFRPDPATARAAADNAPLLAAVSPERVFAELRGVLCSDDPVRGLRLMDELAITRVVLPEVQALRGVTQSRFHHLDVYEHTLETVAIAAGLARDPAGSLGDEHARSLRELLAEPLADELTRAGALVLAALLHDVAKPRTRGELPDARVTFVGHDVAGAHMVRAILTRLRASDRLRSHVADMTRNHLRLGFLVHERPLSRRGLYGYLRACSPVEVDVTLLSVADRLATRGDRAAESIEAHLELAREVLGPALAWHASGPPVPLVRGDELARELGIAAGPRLGLLLEELRAAQYAGEVRDREQAIAHARARLAAARE